MKGGWDDLAFGAAVRRERIETECTKLERAADEKSQALKSLQNHRRSLIREIPMTIGDAAKLLHLARRLESAAASLSSEVQIISAELASASSKRKKAHERERYSLEMHRLERQRVKVTGEVLEAEEVIEVAHG